MSDTDASPDASSGSDSDHVEEILDRISDDADVTEEDIREDFETLTGNMGLDVSRAKTELLSKYETEAPEAELLQAADVEPDDEWFDMEVTVDVVWKQEGDAVRQVGRVGDESGTIKFVEFYSDDEDSDMPLLEEGESYRIESAVANLSEYQGNENIEVRFQPGYTEAEELDEDVEIGENTIEKTAAIIATNGGTGLIKRCGHEDCTNTLDNDQCVDHGDMSGDFESDLRIIAVTDDGHGSEDDAYIIGTDLTKELIGMDVEEAEEKARDAMDRTVIEDDCADAVVGRYFEFTLAPLGDIYWVVEMTPVDEADTDYEAEAAEKLDRALEVTA